MTEDETPKVPNINELSDKVWQYNTELDDTLFEAGLKAGEAGLAAKRENYANLRSTDAQKRKKAYEAMKAVRGPDYLWFQLAEATYDTYMMIQQRKGLV